MIDKFTEILKSVRESQILLFSTFLKNTNLRIKKNRFCDKKITFKKNLRFKNKILSTKKCSV